MLVSTITYILTQLTASSLFCASCKQKYKYSYSDLVFRVKNLYPENEKYSVPAESLEKGHVIL